jgi:hypothetical protein
MVSRQFPVTSLEALHGPLELETAN